MVMDETDCLVEATRRMSEFFAHESCGKCTPCREGTWWVSRVLGRIENGYGRPEDLALLEDVAQNILFRAFCALADGAVSPIQSSLKHFRAEYEQHVAERRCPLTVRGPGPGDAALEPDGPPRREPTGSGFIRLSEVLR